METQSHVAAQNPSLAWLLVVLAFLAAITVRFAAATFRYAFRATAVIVNMVTPSNK
jgi:hypothetical protein